jgi:integrase
MANYYFRLRDANCISETPIILYATFNGYRIKCKTNKSIAPSNWNFDTQTPEDTKKFKELNKRLVFLLGCADVTYKYFTETLNKIPSSSEFQNRFYELALDESVKKVIEAKPLTLFTFIENFIKEAKFKENDRTGRPISPLTIGTYKQCERYLKLFNDKKKRIDFNDIDLDFYYQFKEYLISKKLSQNTIAKHIKTLKTFLNDATDRGISTNFKYKSKKFIASQVSGDAIYLNESELDEFYNLDLSNNEKLERVRDLFLVGCYTGLRYSDWSIKTEDIKGDFIETITQKTNERVVIPIHPTIKAIMKRYEGKYPNSLPPSISNQNMNKYLKDVAGMIDNLQTMVSTKKTIGRLTLNSNISKALRVTTHTARRSFATNLYNNGIPAVDIMKITAHTTEKNFLKYIRSTPKDSANKILEFYNKEQKLKIS